MVVTEALCNLFNEMKRLSRNPDLSPPGPWHAQARQRAEQDEALGKQDAC